MQRVWLCHFCFEVSSKTSSTRLVLVYILYPSLKVSWLVVGQLRIM